MNILKKKYSDLTVGELIGWGFFVGGVTLAVELCTLKGVDEVKQDVKILAKAAKDKACGTFDDLKEKFKK